jgi:hypothetical protein
MDLDISNLKKKVFGKQKILANIYRKYGNLSLLDYVDTWTASKSTAHTASLFGQIKKLLPQIYPENPASGVLPRPNRSSLVSTIDHHGILNHPFFVNSNLIYSLRKNQKFLLCLSTAGVSLNNSSRPGCLLVTGPGGRMRRFSFFPDKTKTQTVLAAKGLVLKDVERIKSQISVADFFAGDNKQQLIGLVEEIFQNEKFLCLDNFSKQAAYASTAIWAKVFPDAPKLFYLPLEELVASVIADEIGADKEHILHKLFFTVSGWDSIEKYFLGSLGAFSGAHKGSFLFWGIDGKGRRIHLARQKNKLVGGDDIFAGDADSLISALKSGKLYPASLACFLVLLYYGVTCLGGFNQVNWLTDIKEKFMDLLAEWGEADLAASVAAVPTQNFAEGALAFGLNQQAQIYKPTLLDLFFQNDPGLFKKYSLLAGKITLSESIDSALPEIYKVIVPAENRDIKLLGITEEDIFNRPGIKNKIKSVFRV